MAGFRVVALVFALEVVRPIPVIYGTASTREDLGYSVPPGTYRLKVQMRFRHGLGGPPTNALTAPLTQITIIPRVRPHRGASP